ncbi:hypothetical protein NDU88_009269 [Pleurodeles waltl]|uniref:Uncharacterized protein n=1 Tax=Pleurodeles waltl TaxID=8319 RepID=A0AAV7QU34_PLEWA|nr:hypothetical protein NDU88_009269 [Pleurodeles waltl]
MEEGRHVTFNTHHPMGIRSGRAARAAQLPLSLGRLHRTAPAALGNSCTQPPGGPTSFTPLPTAVQGSKFGLLRRRSSERTLLLWPF